ncbi:MAG: cysteate synthase [Bacteroidales bacterium]|jgi:cysteate synthase|nr:cysteate synthase [Bacteroidales bacterium]
MEIEPTDYTLINCATKREFKDEGWTLADPESPVPSLVRAVYKNKQINIKDNSFGFYKYADWLPISRMLERSHAPVTYKSKGLASELGLDNLYITFSGYNPGIGACMESCSFKETEAYSVCARLPKENKSILVVASAGNTARAFAKVCSHNHIPLVISIPHENLDALWFIEPLDKCVKVICTPDNSDYFDAIQLAGKLCESPLFLDEGGAKNVARRDGMGTTFISAAEFIGSIPDVYFQAVGSGTGTIAAHETNMRLIEDGRFGNTVTKLIASQNAPFTPMYDAYKAGKRELKHFNQDVERARALEIVAKVLSNRKPPYSLAGGLYDSLKEAGGEMESATNREIEKARKLFEKTEGIDIYHAAACAVASLEKAIRKGSVKKDQKIMLNITGGGEDKIKEENRVYMKKSDLIFPQSAESENIISAVTALF